MITEQRDSARSLYDLLAPYTGCVGFNGICLTGMVDWALASGASLLGDRDAALVHAQAATSVAQRMRAPAWIAMSERIHSGVSVSGTST